MSNSALVNYTLLSPNRSARTRKISRITIHHMAVVWSVEQCGQSFQSPSRKASSNYGIDSDGRVGLYVPEEYRAWTSSSSWNDDQAVTIEVSNSAAAYPWPVSEKAYEKLIRLCADICMRNGFTLNYTGDKNGSLTRHNMFAATLCPGPYLEERFPAIAEEVNKRVAAGSIYAVKERDVEDAVPYKGDKEDDERDAGGKSPAHEEGEGMKEEEIRKLIAQAKAEVLGEVTALLAGIGTNPSAWIEKSGELAQAKALGITDGTRPGGYARREEVAAMVLRALRPPDGGEA